MRRRLMVLGLVGVVAAACGSDSAEGTSAATSTTSSSSATTATAAPSTSSTAPETTAMPGDTTTTVEETPSSTLPAGINAALTVANSEGAFLVEGDFLFQLVDGPVELAIADGSGGLVFQRSSDPGWPLNPETTIISFLPPDSFEPQDMLVPTGDQYLKLWDVEDGVVWYTRREGDSPETASETLRTYDQASRTVDQFAVTGGWESGSNNISVADATVAAYWHAEATSGFTYYAESGSIIGFAGDPYGPDNFCGDGQLFDDATGDFVGPTCYEYAELSDDGRLAFYERDFDGAQVRYILVVVDMDTGEELFRQDLERPDQGWAPHAMDIKGNQVLVNRTESGEWGAPYIDAFLIDLGDGSVIEVGFPGQARFLRGPMGIS